MSDPFTIHERQHPDANRDDTVWELHVCGHVIAWGHTRQAMVDHRAGVVAQIPECAPRGTCAWAYDDTHEKYDTACGEAFVFIADGPIENSFKFCPYCGRSIEVSHES